MPDKTCARVPFASPLSGQVKGPGQGRVPFLASFDRCQGLRIDDHADYHSLLSRKGLRFFFPLFCAKNVTRRNLVRPGKMITGARREFGLVRPAFDARSKMDLRGRGREREKRCSFRAKKNLLVFNSQFAIVGPFFFSLSVFQVAKWNFFLHFRRKTVK